MNGNQFLFVMKKNHPFLSLFQMSFAIQSTAFTPAQLEFLSEG